MHLDPIANRFHDHLTSAARLGDDRTREIAESVAAAAVPAVRLAVLEAVSAAADEITAALLDHPGSPAVAVSLDGNDIRIGVRSTQPPLAVDAEPAEADAGEPSARVSLRLTERLKSDVDSAAARDGVSVNTWLVRAATAALRPNPFAQLGAGFARGFGGMGSGPGGPGSGGPHGPSGWGGWGGATASGSNDQRLSGWIDG